MGRFDRYALSILIRVFGFFALVLVGIYWVNRAVLLLDQYLSEGQSGRLVLELTLLSLPSIMMIVLPIAGFIASAYTTNRLYADSELVVVQATGFSTFRLARPFFQFGLLLALLMTILAHFLVPASIGELNKREVMLAEAISARLIVPGAFQNPTRGVTVYVREVAADGTLEGLLVADDRAPDRESTYTARSAVLVRDPDGPKLIMFDGMAQTLERPGNRLSTTRFTDFTIAIGDLVEPPSNKRLDYKELRTTTLLSPDEELVEATRRSADFLKREAHLRITQAMLSVGAVVLGFAALMVGGFSRFGLWKQISLAVILVVVVKLVDNSTIDLAKSRPEIWPVIYLSSVLSLVLCMILLAIGNAGHSLFRRRRAT